ncbi:hypothetical protein F4779DRAFT_466300 [Xylariaceae sp. FL0662B]|nr:hypothetical protein F4779DRAFT_466300 [Xylariaceae sp. FL0662B]
MNSKNTDENIPFPIPPILSNIAENSGLTEYQVYTSYQLYYLIYDVIAGDLSEDTFRAFEFLVFSCILGLDFAISRVLFFGFVVQIDRSDTNAFYHLARLLRNVLWYRVYDQYDLINALNQLYYNIHISPDSQQALPFPTWNVQFHHFVMTLNRHEVITELPFFVKAMEDALEKDWIDARYTCELSRSAAHWIIHYGDEIARRIRNMEERINRFPCGDLWWYASGMSQMAAWELSEARWWFWQRRLATDVAAMVTGYQDDGIDNYAAMAAAKMAKLLPHPGRCG